MPFWDGFPRYVPVAQRRANALLKLRKLTKKGQVLSPVETGGRTITSTFWGKAWCENLESYSDFSNRLPRGRTYARNGSVLDLRIEPGKVTALVSGTSLYRITVEIKPLPKATWNKVKTACGMQIGSLVELLQGRLSDSVMKTVTARAEGLFPSPGEIAMSCSCPDWAYMCKHVAATLYGVGNRLDREPDLLFKLRQVDHLELIAQAGNPVAKGGDSKKKTIASKDLAAVFGIELESPASPGRGADRPRAKPAKQKTARLGKGLSQPRASVSLPNARLANARSSGTRTRSSKPQSSKTVEPSRMARSRTERTSAVRPV